MTITAMGIKYAQMIHEDLNKEVPKNIWPDKVPPRRRRDAYDAYIEMEYAPPISMPEE